MGFNDIVNAAAEKELNKELTRERILRVLKEREVVYSDLDELLEDVKEQFRERAKL